MLSSGWLPCDNTKSLYNITITYQIQWDALPSQHKIGKANVIRDSLVDFVFTYIDGDWNMELADSLFIEDDLISLRVTTKVIETILT